MLFVLMPPAPSKEVGVGFQGPLAKLEQTQIGFEVGDNVIGRCVVLLVFAVFVEWRRSWVP
jgi:hypothetical protein